MLIKRLMEVCGVKDDGGAASIVSGAVGGVVAASVAAAAPMVALGVGAATTMSEAALGSIAPLMTANLVAGKEQERSV